MNKTTLTRSVCYYTSRANFKKCIDKSIFIISGKKSCSFGDISSQFKRLVQQEVPEQEIRQGDEAKRRAEHK